MTRDIPPMQPGQIVSLGGPGPVVIHLTYLLDGTDQWRIACMPSVANFATSAHHPNYIRSNDTRAVTCPACKKTKVFEEVKAKEPK